MSDIAPWYWLLMTLGTLTLLRLRAIAITRKAPRDRSE
ncbi:hypothetical protein PBI_SMARTIES_75 [Microbacterium phage Smarties]|uniref:Uncharacterized protein n=1 Tax=Microbacterium phage Ariadne TaxID=2656546 RepID=A0A649VAU5_9CAUD|nr:hypothetical protein QDA10_gp075 [Microbacterium phage Ariadne]QGJ89478.1 hypothetical protein PBI_ARIADNE_75 [Microbacterium phage Ariadne]QGJ91465.1 hypothetical protein PBI_SMARTIES_75 [Microbacterium phage Smarties]